MKLLQGVNFMNEDNKRRLAEWYGTRPGAGPVGHTDESERTADLSSQIPPRRPSGSSPTYSEPFWSEDDGIAPSRPRKHLGARIAGICALAVVIIAATALLSSGGGRAADPLRASARSPATRICRSSSTTTTTRPREAPEQHDAAGRDRHRGHSGVDAAAPEDAGLEPERGVSALHRLRRGHQHRGGGQRCRWAPASS